MAFCPLRMKMETVDDKTNNFEEEINIIGRLLKYCFSNNITDIEKNINLRTGKSIDLSNVDWKLNTVLSEKVIEAMNKNNVEYSMTTYIEDNVRRIVVNRQWQGKYFIYATNSKISKIDTLKLSETKRAQLISKALTVHLNELENEEVVYVHEEYVDDKFIQNYWKEIQKVIGNIFEGFKFTETDIDLLYRIIKLDVQKLETRNFYKFIGIVFVGYGDDEILPSMCTCRLFGRLGKNLIHDEIKVEKINKGGSMIYPFAQTDVIDTFIRGIDPSFERKIDEESLSLIFDIADKLGLKYDDESLETIKPLIDAREQFFANLHEYKKENYIDPIFSIVSLLPIINLAEMAEALINITSLRKHLSIDSESVGGPTDVAIISKTDGFTWVKRKNLLRRQGNGA